MKRRKLTQRDGNNEKSAAQVLVLMRQSDQRRGPPTNKIILSASSSNEIENLRSPILSALEAEGGLQIYLQNTNFSKPKSMRLYELIPKILQVSLNKRSKKVQTIGSWLI